MFLFRHHPAGRVGVVEAVAAVEEAVTGQVVES